MIKSEYKNIYENEESHFIYVSMHKSILLLLKKFKNVNKNSKILDAGCGTGLLMKKLEKFGVVYGVDISPDAIKFAKKRGLKNLKVSSVTKLPFKPNTFDVVTCIDVLYHQKVGNDTKALAELKRVLKPNGVLIIKVPAYNWLRGKHDSIAHTKRRFTASEVRRKLNEQDFEIKKLTYANMFIFPLALLNRVISSFSHKEAKSDVKPINGFINGTLVALNSIEDKLIKNLNLPFGLTIFSVASKTSKGNSKKIRKR